jgi:hypothetical protein
VTFVSGFLLGLANGGVCLAHCAPVLVPGLFCPRGAFQSFTNRLNIFAVRIDPARIVRVNLRHARHAP